MKITNFFIDMAHLPLFFEVRDKFVNTKAPPASTAIQVGRLARDGALFEVEAVAVPRQTRAGGCKTRRSEKVAEEKTPLGILTERKHRSPHSQKLPNGKPKSPGAAA